MQRNADLIAVVVVDVAAAVVIDEQTMPAINYYFLPFLCSATPSSSNLNWFGNLPEYVC